VAGGDPVAAVGLGGPGVGVLVEAHDRDARVERDVPAQVEAVGHVVEVAQDLRLGGVALGPGPLLHELVGEGVAVVDALDVAAGAGVAVPVPHPTDIRGGLDPVHPAAELTQPVDGVESGEAGTDDEHVQLARRSLVGHGLPLPNRTKQCL
jgi:hypothetical protein